MQSVHSAAVAAGLESAATHGYGVQVEIAGVAEMFRAEHAAEGRATVHTPVMTLQHAVGWGQGWGVHEVVAGDAAAVPAPQLASGSAMEQAPLTGSQHAAG